MEWRTIDEIPSKYADHIDGWNGFDRIPDMVWATPDGEKKGTYCWCIGVDVAHWGLTHERIDPQPTHFMIFEPPKQNGE